VELFKQTNINWIGRKKWFAGVSVLLFALGLVSYFTRGLNYGIDFTGGTIIMIKFRNTPDWDRLRSALESESSAAPTIQSYGPAASNTLQVRLQKPLGTGEDYERDKARLVASLRERFDTEHAESALQDFNDIGALALKKYLLDNDPDGYRTPDKTIQETETYYDGLTSKLMDYRNKNADGLLSSFDALKDAGASDAVVARLKQDFFTGPFAIKGLESIGAVVGADLRQRTVLAVAFSLAAMMVYIAFRFKPIFGVAAVIALFHDVSITLGIFSLTQKEVSLTVVAALLALIGYSLNGTIVIFDRVRENTKLMRKESYFNILNLSINQTLSRTVLTSGFTLMAAVSLLLFGGDVLNGFSFVLTIGIILGAYSSTTLSSPIVEWWYSRSAAAVKSANKKK
jgi:preprotein translocase subunit SecF